MTDQPPLVRLHGASFGYADRPVVSGVDLELHPREVVALLGPNGSGKSTLVRGILGLTRSREARSSSSAPPATASPSTPASATCPSATRCRPRCARP